MSSAAFAAARHQSAASPPVYGGLAIVIAGRAPSFFSSWRSVSVLARYCAFPADHGVGVCAPKSSFSAITGVEQPVTVTAKSNRRFARSGIDARAVGAVGVPTRLLKLRSKKTVAAPRERIRDGVSVPDETARIIPGRSGSGASWPA